MSAALVKRQKSRRSVAALAFLSNISLDGSHSDTRLAIFNREHDCGTAYECPDQSQDVVLELHNPCNTSYENQGIVSRTDLSFYADGENTSDKLCANVIYCNQIGSDDDYNNAAHTILDVEAKNVPSSSRNISPNRLVRRTSISSESREHFPHQKRFIGTSPSENPSLLGFDSTESLGARSRKRSGSVSESSGSATGHECRIIKVSPGDRIQDERVVLVSKESNIPFMIFSSLPYSSNKKLWSREPKYDLHCSNRKRHISASHTRPLSTISDGLDLFDAMGFDKVDSSQQEISYEHFLVPSRSFNLKKFSREISDRTLHLPHYQNPGFNRCISHDPTLDRLSPPINIDKGAEVEDLCSCQSANVYGNLVYSPHLLDDPELVAGKHRTLLTFTSYITSVMDYAKPTDLKRELNDKFNDRFPHIQLTLTKLRSLKREMKKVVSESGTELLTVALSYVYFEKLVLKGFINKQNRKSCAGACMLLAAKLNDVKGVDLKNQIERTETVFRLSRKELLDSEFPVLVALEFSLHVPTGEVFPHYQRLIYG